MLQFIEMMKKFLCVLMSMVMLLSSTAFVRGASLLAGESTHSALHHRNYSKINIANSRTAVLLNASETDEQELEEQDLNQEDFYTELLSQFYRFQLLNKGSSTSFKKSQHLELLSYTPVYILFHSIRLYSC